MPTCSQAKILTNLESGIQRRASHTRQPLNVYESNNDQAIILTDRDNYYYGTNYADRKSPPLNSESTGVIKTVFSGPRKLVIGGVCQGGGQFDIGSRSHRIQGYKNRRVSIDELQMNQFEQKILHKVPIVFEENLKKEGGSYFLNNINKKYHKHHKINVLRTSVSNPKQVCLVL